MLVSIIVPTLNEERYIANCLKSLQAQTYPEKEIIVCDNGSADRTVAIAKKLADRIVTETKKGPANAINRGCGVAKGEIFITVGADTMLPPEYVDETVKAIEGHIGVFANQSFIEPECPRLAKLANSFIMFYQRSSVAMNRPALSGSGLVFRRKVWQKLGGFRNDVAREDMDFSFRTRKLGRFAFIKGHDIKISARRFIGQSTSALLKTGLRGAWNAIKRSNPENQKEIWLERQNRPV
jgi:glycosyltransferase involved in cell wall biosynthesis